MRKLYLKNNTFFYRIEKSKLRQTIHSQMESGSKKTVDFDLLRRFLGCSIDETVIYINEHSSELNENQISLLETLSNSTHELEHGTGSNFLIAAMKIMKHVLSIGLNFDMTSLTAKIVSLVIGFLKRMFGINNLEVLLDTRSKANEIPVHELHGIAEKLKRTERFLNGVEDKETVDEPTLHSLISNFDIHSGIDQIGNLKSRIASLRHGSEEDLKTCLHFLTLFVRISTIRHLLLLRMVIFLKANRSSINALSLHKNYLWDEIVDGQKYLRFFSEPSLEHVGILAVFDPSVHVDLATYLECVVQLPLQDLHKLLDDKIFLIQPMINPSQVLGRTFPSILPVRGMSSTTDVDNTRIKFKFTAVKDKPNVFTIQSPDCGEYMLLSERSYCLYSTRYKNQIGAQWRVIHVQETGTEDNNTSVFVFCTRKQPRNFLYLEKSLMDFARGLEDTKHTNKACLFKVTITFRTIIP